jgi:hypothetical protein
VDRRDGTACTALEDRIVANGVVRIGRACEIKAIVIVAARIADGGAYPRMRG